MHRARSPHCLTLIAAVLIHVPGCDSSRGGNAGDDADAPIWDDVATVQPADMAKLLWIEGDWLHVAADVRHELGRDPHAGGYHSVSDGVSEGADPRVNDHDTRACRRA
jgi:hypothetical protein